MRLKINWGERISELVVVFLGVTMAFVLDSWKEKQQASENELKYLKGILSDLETDMKELSEKIDTTEFFAEASEKLIQQISSKSFDDDSASEQHFYALITILEFYPNTGTYNSLSATGNLSIIRDFDLNKKITDLYIGQYQSLLRIEELSKDWIYQTKIPYLQKNIPFDLTTFQDTDVFYENEFMNIARSSLYFWQKKLEFYKLTLAECQQLHSAITDYIYL